MKRIVLLMVMLVASTLLTAPSSHQSIGTQTSEALVARRGRDAVVSSVPADAGTRSRKACEDEAAPTVRPPALPEEEPEREAAAEVYEPVRKMTVTGPDLHALAGDLHDDVRKVLITLRKMHTEARPEKPTEPTETPEESPAPTPDLPNAD